MEETFDIELEVPPLKHSALIKLITILKENSSWERM